MGKKFWTASQLFLSKDHLEQYTPEMIRKKLGLAVDSLGLKAIMIWSPEDLSVLKPVIRYCKELSIEVYAWFPLLSDLSFIDVKPDEYVTDYLGNIKGGDTGAWELKEELETGFSFVCPNNEGVTRKVYDFLTTTAHSYDFDGFFFDKIRYPSPANGFEALFTCFCPSCYDKFAGTYGYSLDKVKERVVKLTERIASLTDDQLDGIPTFNTLITEAGLDDFFSFRKESIFNFLKKCTGFASGEGKKVALDLFSISISGFVSQDYARLGALAQWIKPMIYCHVTGPAGIPLEIACFIKALTQINPGLSEEKVVDFARRILEVDLESTSSLILKNGIDSHYTGYETKKMKAVLQELPVKVYPGVEAILNPLYGASINEEILAVYLEEIQQNADGFVASWNILDMSDENIEFMGSKIE